MPRFPDQVALALKLPGSAVRVHNDVDVGGSYGVKRGIKHAVLVGYLARRLGFPVRLVEDRLENMRAGDGHGPERNFDIEVAFDDSGVIRSMKMRALDNVGAYAGRSPFQLGKPIGAIVGPYRIRSVQYRAIAVTSNKTRRRRCVHSANRRRTMPSSARSRRSPGIADSTGWKYGAATSSAPTNFPTSSRAAPPMTAATTTR
jgi:CO/xanthine dehydrogenase Mo-binding subunit